jgi:hypothetical protein
MMRLHPLPDCTYYCPHCNTILNVKGWYIPGMRNLADLKCPRCGIEYYGDLLAGHGLYYPMILEKNTGHVYDRYGVEWFANWLKDSYANRINSKINFTIEEFRPLTNVVLLNCLDALYGHSLLKLLNAQYYLDKRKDLDLVVIVPKFLRWMVPDNVAAIWTVDLPLRRGTEWNDWLAGEIKSKIEKLGPCWLSVGFSHPDPAHYNIERFTRVHPFQAQDWEKCDQPVITFIWRDDRCWVNDSTSRATTKIKNVLRQRFKINIDSNKQRKRVIRLSDELRRVFPNLDFAVAGLGQSGNLPGWIKDMRTLNVDDAQEKKWCERYARSHIVVGVHGSNMLLPSAHSGAVVELMPLDRWGNMLQDLLLADKPCRENLFSNRLVPISVSPGEIAAVIISLLNNYQIMMLRMSPEYSDHDKEENYRLIHENEEHLRNLGRQT